LDGLVQTFCPYLCSSFFNTLASHRVPSTQASCISLLYDHILATASTVYCYLVLLVADRAGRAGVLAPTILLISRCCLASPPAPASAVYCHIVVIVAGRTCVFAPTILLIFRCCLASPDPSINCLLLPISTSARQGRGVYI
jgi:hypothetical protein